MADKKISALTGATTPLAGTEVLPVVQGGATVKVAVSDLTAGRAISATSVTASTGNFVVGTSGQGVDFSATPGTGTSELLADYEEGTWTPQLSTATPPTTPFTMATSNATYTKIGRQVTVRANVSTTSVNLTGAAGVVFISGLPFAVASGGWAAGSVAATANWAVNFPSECEAEAGTSNIYLIYRTLANGASSYNQSTDITAGAVAFGNLIYINVTYFV